MGFPETTVLVESASTRRLRSALVRQTIPFAQEHVARSWWHLISTMAILALLLALTAAPLAWWTRMCAGLIAGLVTCRMFIIYHDYQHKAILRGSRLARPIMTLFGLLSLNPPSSWNRSHEYHHRHNAQLMGASHGSFPVMTTTAYALATRRQRLAYVAARHPLTLLLGYVTVFIVGMCMIPLRVSPRRHWDCGVALVLHAGILASLAVFAPLTMLFAVIVPMFIAGALGSYLFYVQHNFPAVNLRQRSEWDYVFAALQSSSFLDAGPMMHWFTGNIGYHHVHHLNARIPFYRLPEAMAAIDELQSPARTSLRVGEIIRCLRLKLWCPQRNCMVGFGQL